MPGPEAYLEKVKKLSEISEHQHGISFEPIVRYLGENQRYPHYPPVNIIPSNDAVACDCFAWVIQCDSEPYPLRQDALHDCEKHSDNAHCAKPLNRVVLLCGYPSPNWIKGIGSSFSIDFEFWRRHLDFLSID